MPPGRIRWSAVKLQCSCRIERRLSTHLLQRWERFSVTWRVRIKHAGEEKDYRSRDVGATGGELGELNARKNLRGRVFLRDRCESEEVLDRVLEAGEVTHRVYATGGILVEETWRDACCSVLENRELVGVDCEVVDLREGPEVASFMVFA